MLNLVRFVIIFGQDKQFEKIRVFNLICKALYSGKLHEAASTKWFVLHWVHQGGWISWIYPCYISMPAKEEWIKGCQKILLAHTLFAFVSATAAALMEFPAASFGTETLSISPLCPPGAGFLHWASHSRPVPTPFSPRSWIISENPLGPIW